MPPLPLPPQPDDVTVLFESLQEDSNNYKLLIQGSKLSNYTFSVGQSGWVWVNEVRVALSQSRPHLPAVRP